MGTSEVLLDVSDLSVEFRGAGLVRRGGPVSAVRGVSLSIGPGETLGLVGESGSGKSTLGKAILGLVRPSAGRILFRGSDITYLGGRRRRALARHLQGVFQDPNGSLSPSQTVGQTLAEPVRVVLRTSRREAADRAADMLRRVGLPPDTARSYPAQLSGGQRQRVAIARALMLGPDLVVCDEPTSALDLSVQAQILNLLLDLQQQLGLSYLFISHDIAVVRHVSHRVAVLLGGTVMELARAEQLATTSRHPYTAALLAAAPVPDPRLQAVRRADRLAERSKRAVTSRSSGCPFAGRCPSEVERCGAVAPPLLSVPGGGALACHVHGREPSVSRVGLAVA